MRRFHASMLACGVLIGLIARAGEVRGGEAVDLMFLAFSEAGPVPGETLPGEFAENLAARPDGLEPTLIRPSPWSDVFRPRARPLLVTVQVTMGSRIELVALLVDVKGVARLAACRPASRLFDARMDQGQPGPGQGAVNAWRELAADLHWARRRQPAGVDGSPVRVDVKSLQAEAGSPWGGLASGDVEAIEAMALAALVMDGRAAMPGEPADVVIRASRRVVFDVSVEGPVPCHKPSVRQEDLFPVLRVVLRKCLVWGVTVSDAQLLDPAWEPVAVAGVSTSQVAVTVAGEIVAFSAEDGRPGLPDKSLTATSAIPEAVQARVAVPSELPASPLLGPLVFGKQTLLLTRSRRLLFLDPAGGVAGERLLPDRVHAALPLCEDGVLQELVLIDVAGVVWTWQPGQDAPVRRVDLRMRPNGPLVLAPKFIVDWGSVPADAAEDADVVVETRRMLLTGTVDGFLVHMPYPLRGEP